jgi:hypothetical protein
MVNNIRNNLPAAADSKPPGYLPVRSVRLSNAVAGGAK